LIKQIIQFFRGMGGFGLVGLGILDSSFLFLPFGNDILLVMLTARKPELFWYYAIMATIGSVIGCVLTDTVSRKIGEAGMEKMVNPQKMKAIRKRMDKRAPWLLAGAALMPPPFPFTFFLIAASGMQMSRVKVLSSVGFGRLVRFFALAVLAYHYGRQILAVAERDEVEYVVIGLAVVSVIGSALSVAKWIRTARHQRPPQKTAYAEG
jgi:membrane protein YqaA with SNARE-associated domain